MIEKNKVKIAGLTATLVLLMFFFAVAQVAGTDNELASEPSGTAQALVATAAAPESVEIQYLAEPPAVSPEEQQRREEIVSKTHLPGPSLSQEKASVESAGAETDANILAAGTFTIFKNSPLGAAAVSKSTVNEPSLANSGNYVFYSGNWYAARSIDGGSTFSYVNPYADMPTFCCDQDVLYEGSRDIFIWYRQGVKDVNGENYFRLGISNDKGATWYFYNFKPSNVNSAWTSQWWDYPHLALSDNYLYIASNIFDPNDIFIRTVILRFPLDALKSHTGFNYNYFPDSTHFTFTPVQGATSTIYWGAHHSNSVFRLFSLAENTNIYNWYDIAIPAWTVISPGGSASCPSPDGYNWCARSDSRISSGWVANGIIGFFWNAKQGGNFPYPYIEAATFKESDKSYVGRPYIWNSNFAWQYGYASPDMRGYLGVSAFYGGGNYYPNHAVAIDDDFNGAPPPWELVTTNIGTNGPSNEKWGDYLRVRPYSPSKKIWVASGYTLKGGNIGSNTDPRYIVFGRERDAPPNPNISVVPLSISVTLPVNQETVKILNISNIGSADLLYTIKDTAAVVLFFDDMEAGVNNWKADGLWHQSQHRYKSPATAWYYGKENVWNYDTGAPNKGNLTSPLIDLSNAKNAVLTFWRWEKTEGGEYWDHRHVYISADNGATWNNIYISKGIDQGIWVKESIDISSYIGKKVLVRFEFDTIDASANAYEGWYVDDVAVIGEGAADWLSESPTAGTVVPGGTHLINVKINSTGLAPAAYNADIIIASNDPDEAVVKVPVSLQVSPGINGPPNIPSIPAGSTTGNVGVTYIYSSSATDPDFDQVKLTFDWGDGTQSTTPYVNSGTPVSATHAWNNAGTYSVKAMATDAKGATSAWSPVLQVTITGIPVGTIVSIQDAAAAPGANVTVPIKITNATSLGGADIWLSYDKNVVIVESIADGDLGALAASNIDNANGITKMNWFSATGKTGNFVFAYVTLKAVGTTGQTSGLNLTVKELVDANGVAILHKIQNGKFVIGAALMEGDVNINKHVTITDALLIAKYKAGLIVLTPDQLKCADTNDDGSVTITDALYISKWLANPAFPLWDPVKDFDMLQPVP